MSLGAVAGGAELLDDFYTVYARTMRDLGSPPHSRKFFALLIELFEDQVEIHSVRDGPRALAAGLTLRHGGSVHLPWAGNDRRFRHTSANTLLYWSMLQAACRNGAGVFDFGRSTVDGGTYQFKKQWGATAIPLHWHYILSDRPAESSSTDDANGVAPPASSGPLNFAQACWRRMPLWLSNRLGPRIIRKLA